MKKNNVHNQMRTYHRYLGYFLAGIMLIYATSGVILIFRDTNFLKHDKVVEKQITPGLDYAALGKELRIKDLKVESDDGSTVSFHQGSYNKQTGKAKYTVKELLPFVEKLTRLHKASTKDPLFFLNVFFGLSLLFFVVSSFWMFLPNTTIFKKGLYFTLAGSLLVIIMLLL